MVQYTESGNATQPTSDEKASVSESVVIPSNPDEKTRVDYELTYYVNDVNTENTQVLMEYGKRDELKSVYTYGNERISAETVADTVNPKTDALETDYYLYDGRGSVAQVVSGDKVVESYTYDPFGNVTSGAPEFDSFYGYNAEDTNPVTGLQYLRARYYDTEDGRFSVADTYLGDVSEPLTLNRYSYTVNNPTNYIDPTGHFFKEIFGVAAGLGKAVVDGVGGLVTGKGTSGFKSGWESGYKAGSSVGKKVDNAILNTVDNWRNNSAVKKISKANDKLQDLQERFDSASNGKDKAKIRQQIEKIEKQRRELCEKSTKLQKQMDARGKNDYATIPKLYDIELPEKQLEEEYDIEQNKNKKKPVNTDIVGNSVNMTVYVEFIGDVDAVHEDSGALLRDLIIEGISLWNVSGNSYGYEMNTNIDIIQRTDKDAPTDQKYVTIQIVDDYGISNVSRKGSWSPTNTGVLTMYKGDSRSDDPTPYSEDSYTWTATHEIGHIFGLGDAYASNDRPQADEELYDRYNVMSYQFDGINISDIDLQMLILAQESGKQQFYQDYNGRNRSEGFDWNAN